MKIPENPTRSDHLPDRIPEHKATIDTEAVLSSIMTAKEYSTVEHATPYIFELKAGDAKLCYFGAPHVRDIHSPLFAEIEKTFNDTNPDIVFVEGISNININKAEFNNRMLSATTEEIIDAMGESGFTLKLALEKGNDLSTTRSGKILIIHTNAPLKLAKKFAENLSMSSTILKHSTELIQSRAKKCLQSRLY